MEIIAEKNKTFFFKSLKPKYKDNKLKFIFKQKNNWKNVLIVDAILNCDFDVKNCTEQGKK